MTYPRLVAVLAEQPELTDEQRQALRILADCFADDGIVDDARNIRDALACLHAVETRATEAETERSTLRSRLDETERRLRAAETAAARDGWKLRAETAEGQIERLVQERNEARSAAQALLASLKSQGQAAETADASTATLRQRVEVLEEALRQASEIMQACGTLLAIPGRDETAFGSVDRDGDRGPDLPETERTSDVIE